VVSMKKIFFILVVILAGIGLFGCQKNSGNKEENITYTPREILQPLKNPDMGWTTYSFKPYTDTVAVFGGQMSKYTTNVYSNYFSWRDLEPEEGVYDFTPIDNFIRLWKDYDLDVAIGIHMADATSLPGQIHVPQYIYEQVGGRWITELYGGQFTLPYPTWEPYYWEEKLLDSWENFLRAFAKEYESNVLWQEKITQFDISSFGQWGEWHTDIFYDKYCRQDPNSSLYGKTDEQVKEIQVKTMERMSKQYTDIFLDKEANIEYPRLTANVVYSTVTYGEYVSGKNGTLAPGIKSIIEAASTGGVDMFRRFIGGEYYLYGPDKEAILNNWQRLRFHGEWGSATGGIDDGDFGNNKVGNPTTTQQAVQMALDYHSSTLGWYVRSILENRKVNISEVPSGDLYMGKDYIVWSGMTLEEYYQVNCGYRLVLESVTYPAKVKSGDTICVDQRWSQKGCATVYDKYDLKFYLVADGGEEYVLGTDYDFDARGWIKKDASEYKKYSVQSSFCIPEVPEGYYELMLAVVDKQGSPAINLAIEGKDTDGDHYGKYGLGYIAINDPEGKKPIFTAEKYSEPTTPVTKRPSLKAGYGKFAFGEEDGEYVGYAGFSFIAKQEMQVWDLGYAVKQAANSYPITLSIVDVKEKKCIVFQTFRFGGIGTLEYGQLAEPVILESGKEYAVLAKYGKETENLYGENQKIKVLYYGCTLSEFSENIGSVHAVTSPDGLNIVKTTNGENRSNGVLNFKYILP